MVARTAPRSSPLLLAAAAVLAALLIGAGAYIAQLRAQLAAQTAQLQPFLAAAQTLYPDAAPDTALRSIAQRLGEMRPPLPASATAAAPAAVTAAPIRLDELLTAAQQDAMLAVLRNEADSGRKAWFLVAQNNAESLGVQAALQSLFEQAGWPVETQRAPYPLKAGVFMLAGDETPPAFVDRVDEAFRAAALDVQYLTGYRAFYAERKAQNPKWVGPALADDQPFTIVVGSRPKAKAAAE